MNYLNNELYSTIFDHKQIFERYKRYFGPEICNIPPDIRNSGNIEEFMGNTKNCPCKIRWEVTMVRSPDDGTAAGCA